MKMYCRICKKDVEVIDVKRETMRFESKNGIERIQTNITARCPHCNHYFKKFVD